MANIQVTLDSDLNNARSESTILINPNNPQQIVAASKKFNNIHTYDFTLATEFSADGGRTWQPSSDFVLPAPATVMTDPTLAWDDAGNVYMVGLLGRNPPTWNTIGMAVYKSADGGQTWGNANVIHSSAGDDKQWAAGDANPSSPFHGRVYACWDDGSTMRFARTLDHGATWIGAGTTPIASTNLAGDSFSPEINVSTNGDVYIVWIAGSTIKMIVSTDGGASFHAVTAPATGVTTLSASLPAPQGFPVLPGGTFRVLTLPTACVFNQTAVVAWDDFREGASRIYFALSSDRGSTWTTGTSGQPLLGGGLPSTLHHILPQLIFDPNSAIGCAFYEFGPKPTTPLIDVIMAQSFDGGATFNHFTVTDAPWNPAVNAPFSHGNPNLTFIGDYFGIDASQTGFYPLWTDTRTGVQELFTAIVPEKKCAFIVNRSTLGQDEVDARRTSSGAIISDVFRIVVDGFAAGDLGVTSSNSTLPAMPILSPSTGMNIVPHGNVSATMGYGSDVQRFTFIYDIDFGHSDNAFGFPSDTRFVNLDVSVGPTAAHAQLELIKQPNPYLLHGDTFWLAIDLRVFVVRQGEDKFGVPGVTGPADVPRFIQQLISTMSPTQFDTLSADEAASSLSLQPQDEHGNPVFNFAVAKVHYTGLIGANTVRVFFRLFQAQTTSGAFDFPPGVEYRRAASNPHGQPIALAGIRDGEYVTIPCFATARVDSTAASMTQQTDDPNIRNFGAGTEVDRIFGCWLDINQPFDRRLPALVPGTNVDGPFTNPGNPALSIQQSILRNLHQCLIAEIAFDPVPIPPGKDSSNWDKLAQRNLAWSDAGSATAVTTFEVRATPLGLRLDELPDELMIDWGDLPKGAVASIYLPAADADEILALAGRMYTAQSLTRLDDHSLQCKTGGITYVPIPVGKNTNYAGLLTIDLPFSLRRGHVYNVVLRQVTNAFSRGVPPRQIESGRGQKEGSGSAVGLPTRSWRRVLGAFQLSIPAKAKEQILPREERDFSVLQWIGEAIPAVSRWKLVFNRYLEVIAGRVKEFGGDPISIQPSPTGDGKATGHPGGPGGHERELCFTGKVDEIFYDRYGDFEGFSLNTVHGEQGFRSCEREVARLVERAWRERLRITVCVAHQDRHRLLNIVVHQPPVPFGG